MTFPILASLLVRLVVLLPFQLLRLSLATPSRWTPLRSEERFSRNAETDLVCRLLLEKKKRSKNHRCPTRATSISPALGKQTPPEPCPPPFRRPRDFSRPHCRR